MREKSPQSRDQHRPIRSIGMIAGLSMLLTGCTTSAESDEVARMSPVVRFSHDYANGWESGPAKFGGHDARASGQDGCLDGSPYDPFNGDRKAGASLLVTPEGNYQVIPANEAAGSPKLTFLKPQGTVAEYGTLPLVPADDATKGVLAAYYCVTDAYPRYNN